MGNKAVLLVLLVIALLGLVGFFVYDYSSRNGEKSDVGIENASTDGEAVDGKLAYLSKIKVTFTDNVYPLDSYQANLRLRRYVGKVQNMGDQSISYLNIRVEYLDKENKAIWENNVAISKILKPNFIEEFQFGGLDVPSDWSGKVSYEITGLKFQNDYEIQKFYPSKRTNPLDRNPLQQILIFPNL